MWQHTSDLSWKRLVLSLPRVARRPSDNLIGEGQQVKRNRQLRVNPSLLSPDQQVDSVSRRGQQRVRWDREQVNSLRLEVSSVSKQGQLVSQDSHQINNSALQVILINTLLQVSSWGLQVSPVNKLELVNRLDLVSSSAISLGVSLSKYLDLLRDPQSLHHREEDIGWILS